MFEPIADSNEAMGKSKSLGGAPSLEDGANRGVPPKSKADDDIASLTAEMGSVSIGSSNAAVVDAPEAIKDVADLISSNKYKNIVVLSGAGISCNAGIPGKCICPADQFAVGAGICSLARPSLLFIQDFRTEGTGLYDNLQKYNLPYPEAVFDLSFYRNNPDPFVQLASELWPGLKHSPTVTHSFIALLEKKGLLLRNYTQVCQYFVFIFQLNCSVQYANCAALTVSSEH